MSATYTAAYGHEENCTPGRITITASNRDEAIAQARKFVEDGFRNLTWISLDLGDCGYAARNVHGRAVGELTSYETGRAI